jgi:serine/threonine-protein kinase RsbT
VITSSYPIAGGDFASAGCASRGLKERLRRIGVEAEVMRRVMITAYEAEMNVVIHARRGNLWARFDDGRLDLEIADEGPGIPDLEQALTPGYSTASAEARALGFGAGMGLPNIRRASDQFEIASEPGRGTTLRATIFLRSQLRDGGSRISLHLAAERCIGCLSCLKACPTRAIRLRDGRPYLLERLCIDCTACIAACPRGVFFVPGGPLHGTQDPADGETAVGETAVGALRDDPGTSTTGRRMRPEDRAVLVVPRAFLTHLGPRVSPPEVLAGLHRAGFADVRFTEEWEDALRGEVRRTATGRPGRRPVLSPLCPAVVNLVELQFPALIPNLAPYLSPVEAAREELAEELSASVQLCFVAACPSQRTLLRVHDQLGRVRPIAVEELTARVLSELGDCRRAAGGTRPPDAGAAGGRRDAATPTAETTDREPCGPALVVTGLPNVIRVLEQAEKGLLDDFQVLEPALCPQGCFGSPLFATDAFVAASRWAGLAVPTKRHAATRQRRQGYLPRGGLRLDPDMGRAIAALARVEEAARGLPGRDCGACGSPGCGHLAEDIVLGRATAGACPFREADSGATSQDKEVSS